MTTWICDDCFQEIESVKKPTGCPACGSGPWIRRLESEPGRNGTVSCAYCRTPGLVPTDGPGVARCQGCAEAGIGG